MKGQLAVGGALVAVVTAVLVLAWGRSAVVPGLVFGLVALGIEVWSVRLMRAVLSQPFSELMKRRAVGMGLRLAGIVCFVLAVALRRDIFPPLPAAFGYLGVLIPLLFLEPRFLR